ncbi:hypothetical protein [Pseudomonas syringae]|uniref:Uncharacterized protein n=1 Tax=Pseudomonas syringae pv. actinidifoliorum ICMP 18803 TaxID=1194400 RepID=A0AAT9S9D5_PSESX|nr:hypothetical protein [Pseudomonas syringae]OOK94569.1 hypothetical protein B0B36_22475 [Pseudomonas syringae pv. actinidifoliorum]UYS79033.1 hypothetical protein A237_016190 [Pseudomonas syringae pv. actinidifoliorum ICMP 18803]
MKLLNSFAEQIKACGKLKRVWLTSFNIDIEFIETYLLPADSTTLGHSAHDHLDTHSKLTWTPAPRPLGQAVGAQRRRFALLV